MYKIVISLFLITLSASCVSNKKIIYLQDEFKNKEIIVDSILSTYATNDFEYRLQPDDIISIKVSSLTPNTYNFFSETERDLGPSDPLLSGYLIDENGNIEIPAIGLLRIEGLTLKESEQKVKEALQGFLQDPVVRIKMLNFKITILGEVQRPGTITSLNSKVTLLEAIAEAGDLTELANRSRIKIVRYKNDMANMVYVNTLQDDFLTSPYFYLMPNDLIIVPPLEIKNIRAVSLPTFGVILSTISAITLIILRLNAN
jgi:polysaccharide biosynthesis/export protein